MIKSGGLESEYYFSFKKAFSALEAYNPSFHNSYSNKFAFINPRCFVGTVGMYFKLLFHNCTHLYFVGGSACIKCSAIGLGFNGAKTNYT